MRHPFDFALATLALGLLLTVALSAGLSVWMG
jgi:hypothetical protein